MFEALAETISVRLMLFDHIDLGIYNDQFYNLVFRLEHQLPENRSYAVYFRIPCRGFPTLQSASFLFS